MNPQFDEAASSDEKSPPGEVVPGENPTGEKTAARANRRSWVPLVLAVVLLAVLATVLITAWTVQGTAL